MNIAELYSIFQKYPVISTDSRNCPGNALFFALKGDKFDGNDYIEQALESGAAYAVGDRNNLPRSERIIKVDDALRSLQDLANYHRKQLKKPVIAITGTNGKTTTKELIAAALSSQYPVLYTQGNLNNHIGVPLTLLQLQSGHAFAVIEMGANHPGEIRNLCRIAEPDYGLITNLGKAHLEGFGSFEGVVRTKTELYDFLREKGGIIFCNSDNPLLRGLSDYLSTVYYGTTQEAFVYGTITKSSPYLHLKWTKNEETYEIKTALAGTYNFENVLAAICIASYFKIENQRINQAIENYIPLNNRSQSRKTDRNQLIIDAYNANPSSMEAALDNFLSLPVSPRMVILGEMRELGKYSEKEHRKIVEILIQNKIDRVILVGEGFTKLTGLPEEWTVFQQTTDLISYLAGIEIKGYTLLIKGSRGNQLEKTIDFL
ncbi:MAG: UDP-N-acetylmuramoyl-tripeptide--D-alanyl-D-alanine ligase [Dysgonamonadaceae bacterium]|jgi:UDP-N-acetylmuramoyl-tripeptide--D-alanyl-D-alanine ligase|nr:UDP-N-acetylmuramoyl-tripeptide--D-alanyl-D-alanine ligase [Dysgonamonadaceae bacterium]